MFKFNTASLKFALSHVANMVITMGASASILVPQQVIELVRAAGAAAGTRAVETQVAEVLTKIAAKAATAAPGAYHWHGC
jgi:hypothetical protein